VDVDPKGGTKLDPHCHSERRASNLGHASAEILRLRLRMTCALLIAFGVYRSMARLDLTFLQRGWINVDLVGSIALVAVAAGLHLT